MKRIISLLIALCFVGSLLSMDKILIMDLEHGSEKTEVREDLNDQRPKKRRIADPQSGKDLERDGEADFAGEKNWQSFWLDFEFDPIGDEKGIDAMEIDTSRNLPEDSGTIPLDLLMDSGFTNEYAIEEESEKPQMVPLMALGFSGYDERKCSLFDKPEKDKDALEEELTNFSLEFNPEIDVNMFDSNGLTPLMHAASQGDESRCELLIKRGASVTIKSPLTPLYYAAEAGNVDICKLLISHGASVRGKRGRIYISDSPFTSALLSEMQDEDIIEILYHEDVLWERSPLGVTPLMLCALHDRTTLCQFLCKQFKEQLDLEIFLNASDGNGKTALSYAAENGHVNSWKMLVCMGANFRIKDKNGKTSIDLAEEKHPEIAKELRKSAEPIKQLLRLLSQKRYKKKELKELPKKVEAILNQGVDVNIPLESGQTPLMLAARRGLLEVCHVLIENNADVNKVDLQQKTALSYALEAKKIKVGKFLIKKGAEVSKEMIVKQFRKKDKSLLLFLLDVYPGPIDTIFEKVVPTKGLTPEVLEAFIKKGASINKLISVSPGSGYGLSKYTPLMVAVISGNYNLVKTYIKHEADIHAVSNTGKTPLCLASQFRHIELYKLLASLGANPFYKVVSKIKNWYHGKTPKEIWHHKHGRKEDTEHVPELIEILRQHLKEPLTGKNPLETAKNALDTARKNIIAALCCLKKSGISKDLHPMILSHNPERLKDLEMVLGDRILKGLPIPHRYLNIALSMVKGTEENVEELRAELRKMITFIESQQEAMDLSE